MPRYHFNVYDNATLIDREGAHLADIDVARGEGIRLAGDLLRSQARKEKFAEDWHVDVTDGRGMILFRIDVAVNASAAAGLKSF